ncbi:MAG TPA: hypothetical protein VH590_21615 [Ktedonobacterales bacterium]
MRPRQRRNHLAGALIFAALVVLVGAGFVATGDYYDPILYMRDVSQVIPRSVELFNVLGQPDANNQRSFRRPDPPAQDESDIQWPLIIAPLFDLWALCAMSACYILLQEALGWLIFRVHHRGAMLSTVNSVNSINSFPAAKASEEELL